MKKLSNILFHFLSNRMINEKEMIAMKAKKLNVLIYFNSLISINSETVKCFFEY